MSNKVLLILVDGMRPDSVAQCGDPGFLQFYKSGTYCLQERTVFPSVTLPCHVSLFYSVEPARHGVTTNTFRPFARPLPGIVETLAAAGKRAGFVYTWEQLRDLTTAGKMLEYSWFERQHTDTISALEHRATAVAEDLIRDKSPDFLFLYLGGADEWGHRCGWMSPEYLASVKNAWDCIRHITSMLPEEYTVIVTADHGGHDRSHGEDIPEDMYVPTVFKGPMFEAGKELERMDIRDIAPTIADILGVRPDEEWEGHTILRRPI